MKKVLLLLAFVLTTNSIVSQNEEWLNYDLDSIISIKGGAEMIELDTIVQGMKMYQLYFHTENSSFIAQKTLFKNGSEDFSTLPYDLKSLKEQYKGVVDGMKSGIPYELETSRLVERQGFKGFRLRFKDSLNNPVYQGEIYLLNKNLYSFFYVSLADFSEIEKDLFFNSIKINTDKNISQYLGKSKEYRMGALFGKYFFYILLFGVIIYFVFIKKKKKRF